VIIKTLKPGDCNLGLTITPDGDTLIMPINGRFLKRYYP